MHDRESETPAERGRRIMNDSSATVRDMCAVLHELGSGHDPIYMVRTEPCGVESGEMTPVRLGKCPIADQPATAVTLSFIGCDGTRHGTLYAMLEDRLRDPEGSDLTGPKTGRRRGSTGECDQRKSHDEAMGLFASARCLEEHLGVEARHSHRLIGSVGIQGIPAEVKEQLEAAHAHITKAKAIVGDVFEALAGLPMLDLWLDNGERHRVLVAAFLFDYQGDGNASLRNQVRDFKVGDSARIAGWGIATRVS